MTVSLKSVVEKLQPPSNSAVRQALVLPAEKRVANKNISKCLGPLPASGGTSVKTPGCQCRMSQYQQDVIMRPEVMEEHVYKVSSRNLKI